MPDCGVRFLDERGTKHECNRPIGHEMSAHWQGKHWWWQGDRVEAHEPFPEGERTISKRSNEERW